MKDESIVLFSASDLSYHLSGIYPIRKCSICGLVYLSPRPKAEELIRFYPREKYFKKSIRTQNCSMEIRKRSWLTNLARAVHQVWHGYNFNSPYVSLYFANILLFFFKRLFVMHPYFQLPHFVPGGRLLEIGFGNGVELCNFRRLGWSVAGSDFDQDCCTHARQILEIDIVEIDGVKIITDSESFDVIYLNQAFEHLPDPSGALVEYKRILKKYGQLIMKVPNFECRQAQNWKSLWRGMEVPRHLFFYTKTTISTFLANSGFRDIKVISVNLSPFDVFCSSTPPTIENNERNARSWWNNRVVGSLLNIVCPFIGYGESLFIIARK